MLGKHSSKAGKTKDPAVRAKLTLRDIDGHLCFTSDEAWAWFVLPTQP